MGNRIKELREAAGMSRQELAERSGVPWRTIDDWVSGRRKPKDVYQLKKIADALGCKIEDLIIWEDEVPDGVETEKKKKSRKKMLNK